MKILLLVLGLVLCFASNEDTLFTAWKAQYNKVYNSAEEEAIRFNNFKLSLDRIQSRNALNTETVFGLTKFSDLSVEEFKTLLGYVPSTSSYDVGVLAPNNVEAPQTFDWRTQNMVTPVKDQGQCGSCWAFSVTENIESVYCKANQLDCTTFPPLSPQEIVDCDTTDAGCDGGDPPTAYAFVIQEGGMEDASDYPYTAQDGNCAFQQSLVKVKISSWKYATQNSDETTMMNNLVSWGPLSICVDAEPWQDYTGGVLMASDCSNQLDHCVQLVGYDMTQSTPFWIVRNSWGTDWGENGYIRLQYGQDTCGCADEATCAAV
jgi:C1A family cysteine protease